MSRLEDLFCSVDDFCQRFEPQWQRGMQTQKQSRQLCLREIITIVIAFHQQGYPTFKDYYTKHVAATGTRHSPIW